MVVKLSLWLILFVFQILCDEILSEFEAADYNDQVSKWAGFPQTWKVLEYGGGLSWKNLKIKSALKTTWESL